MADSDSPLSPLLDTEHSLRKEFRRRNTIWDLKTIRPDEEAHYLAEGWQLHRKLKASLKMQRQRNLDERLENKWWVLLYKMGYQEMNEGRQFRVLMKRNRGVSGEKQIDVYARDAETVVVTECKTSERLRSRSLQKDLEEFGSLKGDIAKTIKAFYGRDFKPKILWFFVTENIIWSPEDIARAKANNIRRVTELEVPYYTQLVQHLGHAARFQFLAEFLKDQKIPGLENIKVPATRGKLGGRYFYSFVTTPRHLLKIAFVNHRTLDDPEGHPTYQRLIQKGRLKEIGEFIRSGGYFPNNLLINFIRAPRFEILQKDLSADVHFGHLYLPGTYKSAWIIDGQHRLYGYANLSDSFLDEHIVIVAFEKMSKEEEANLFVTINHEQKPVAKNLLDDLEGQLKWGSADPQERIGAIGARLIQKLNTDLASPFYNRFTAEGIQATTKTCLTVPQVKLGFRRSKLLGSVILKGTYERGALSGTTDNGTLMRAQKVLNSYFSAVMNADAARWDSGREGRICTNEAVQAFTMLLSELIQYFYRKDPSRYLKATEQQLLEAIAPGIEPILNFISSGGADVDTTFTVPFGSGGPREYLMRLARIVRRDYPDFEPPDFHDWETSQSEELKQQADSQIQKITVLVQEHIFKIFRRRYGDAYWDKGVQNKDMKAEAYKVSLDTPVEDRLPIESYLNFISFKKIVDTRENWPIFKPVFDIPQPGVKGVAKNLDWMDRINELRRISAHAAPGRNYKADDFDFIDSVYQTLKDRLDDYDYDAIGNGA